MMTSKKAAYILYSHLYSFFEDHHWVRLPRSSKFTKETSLVKLIIDDGCPVSKWGCEDFDPISDEECADCASCYCLTIENDQDTCTEHPDAYKDWRRLRRFVNEVIDMTFDETNGTEFDIIGFDEEIRRLVESPPWIRGDKP